MPAASLPRVPAHLSPVASSPWWCRACAVPIARFLRAAARLRPLLIYLVLQSGRPPLYAADESCSDRRWLLAFGCVARYYFLATFEARRWRSSPSVGRLMVFLDFLDFLEFLETSEVAGPGPNPREIDISFGAQWPLACVRGPWARQEHLLPAALR